MSSNLDLTAGIALVGMSLGVAALIKMQELHLLKHDDLQEIQQNALQGLERFEGSNTPGLHEARLLLEGILDAAVDVGKSKTTQ